MGTCKCSIFWTDQLSRNVSQHSASFTAWLLALVKMNAATSKKMAKMRNYNHLYYLNCDVIQVWNNWLKSTNYLSYEQFWMLECHGPSMVFALHGVNCILFCRWLYTTLHSTKLWLGPVMFFFCQKLLKQCRENVIDIVFFIVCKIYFLSLFWSVGFEEKM